MAMRGRTIAQAPRRATSRSPAPGPVRISGQCVWAQTAGLGARRTATARLSDRPGVEAAAMGRQEPFRAWHAPCNSLLHERGTTPPRQPTKGFQMFKTHTAAFLTTILAL